MLAKIIKTHPPNTLGGYDIGCSFEGTVKRSSLRELYEQTNTRIVVNAFHGYTHSYECQLKYHPNVIKGIGLEDLETMERIFSASNQLASVTRHSSKYRRRLYIEAHSKQWDDDKYQNLGTFLIGNVRQALDIIQLDGKALDDAMAQLQITHTDLDDWTREEHEFFSQLGKESDYDLQAITYVELLQEFRDLENQCADAALEWRVAVNPEAPRATRSRRPRDLIDSQRRQLIENRARVLGEICDLEVQMGIDAGDRWTPATPQYIEALTYMRERKYRRALDKLQELVVKRLFELHKLNLSQTCKHFDFDIYTLILISLSLSAYKLRTHIAKSLQTRCKAIRNAVAKYNTAAAALTPPRPAIDWSRVSHYGFLDEFHLLQDTRHDIRGKRWAQPVIRNLMKMRNRIARAREELERCNVEIRRLFTSIRDEESLMTKTLSDYSGDVLYPAILDYVTLRRNVNRLLLHHIHTIFGMRGYQGSKTCGTRAGSSADPIDVDIPDLPIEEQPESDDDNDEEEGEHDGIQDDLSGLIQYVASL